MIAGGFCRAAKLRKIQPLPLEQIRPHLPVQVALRLLRLDTADANAILALASPKPR